MAHFGAGLEERSYRAAKHDPHVDRLRCLVLSYRACGPYVLLIARIQWVGIGDLCWLVSGPLLHFELSSLVNRGVFCLLLRVSLLYNDLGYVVGLGYCAVLSYGFLVEVLLVVQLIFECTSFEFLATHLGGQVCLIIVVC